MAGDIYTDNMHADYITDRAGTGGANFMGRTVATAVSAGHLGELIQPASAITTTTATTSEGDINNASIALSAGTWKIHYSVVAYYRTGASSGDSGFTQVFVTDAANTHIGKTERIIFVKTVAAVADEVNASLSAECVVNINSATTYKLRVKRIDNAGTGEGGVIVSAGNYDAAFHAIRIA